VWLVDACLAPLGVLVSHAVRDRPAELLLLLPLTVLVVLVDRDRNSRIAEAQRRLGLVARERTRLQAAVRRLGDAFAAELDLRALCAVVLHGSIDALGGDAGRLVLNAPGSDAIGETAGAAELTPLLDEATAAVQAGRAAGQFERDGAWALALPMMLSENGGEALVIARRDRPFRADEQLLVAGLVERAQGAAAEIVAHELLREQALTDPLTQLGNRRKLADDLRRRLARASADDPIVLLLFDLDGFKSYNDTFGHLAGDALLARLGGKLAASVARDGAAYRLGGDEFCAIIPAGTDGLPGLVAAAAGALEERGETFVIRASCGAVILPHEASNPDYALQLADKRMYSRKLGRSSVARQQASAVLRHIMAAKQPGLPDHSNGVAQLAVAVGRQLGMSSEQLDELARAAELHDVGKVAVCDAYEAIVTDRCYRRARPKSAARAEIVREAGRQFDPTVVGAFLDALDTTRRSHLSAGAAIEDERVQLAAEIAGRVREMLERSPGARLDVGCMAT